MLTTHSFTPREWVSSLWPGCHAAEASAQVKGAALTYVLPNQRKMKALLAKRLVLRQKVGFVL